MIGEIGIAYQRADAQSAVCGWHDFIQRQPIDVDDAHRRFDVALHQIEQIGAAGETPRRRLAQIENGFVDRTGAYVIEGLHR